MYNNPQNWKLLNLTFYWDILNFRAPCGGFKCHFFNPIFTHTLGLMSPHRKMSGREWNTKKNKNQPSLVRSTLNFISIALPMVTIWLQCHEISIVYLMCFMVYECLSLPINTSDNCSTEFDISWSIIGSIREVTIDGIDLKNSEQWTVNSEQWTIGFNPV